MKSAIKALASSIDWYIYGTVDSFVFSYDPFGRLGFLMIRGTDNLVASPLFQQVSASDDGSYFMAGQLLFDNRLTVRAGGCPIGRRK